MAFPTGYTKYQEVTIDSTKVTADLTDFPIFIDLSDLSLVGSDIFDTCRSDGGDIRVTKTDGTTELAREVVAIDTSAKTGELHVKYTGTLSGSTNTVIRIWYNGTDTEPSFTATYGRNNVWSNYDSVLHMEEDPSGTAPQMVDSTGNGNNGTSQGSMTSGDSITGKLSGKALVLDAIDDAIVWDASAISAKTISVWYHDNNLGSGSANIEAIGKAASGYSDYDLIRVASTTSPQFGRWLWNSGSPAAQNGTTDVMDNSWHLLVYTSNNSNDNGGYVDGGSEVSNASSGSNSYVGKGFINHEFGSGTPKFLGGKYDEARIGKFRSSDNWISTEYNNQNSPSTFYSIGAEQGGGGTPASNALAFGGGI